MRQHTFPEVRKTPLARPQRVYVATASGRIWHLEALVISARDLDLSKWARDRAEITRTLGAPAFWVHTYLLLTTVHRAAYLHSSARTGSRFIPQKLLYYLVNLSAHTRFAADLHCKNPDRQNLRPFVGSSFVRR